MDRLNNLRLEPFNQSDEIMAVLRAPSGKNGFGLNQTEAARHPALNGCCLSICFQWMKLKMSNSSESARKRIEKVRLSIANAITRQKLQGELWSIGGGDTNYSAPASFIGVKLTQTDLNRAMRNLDLVGKSHIRTTLRQIKKKCLVMDYRWRDNSGHAVAWYVSSGKMFNARQHIYFFDPNYGEYKVLLKNAQTFINNYFRGIDHDFNGNHIQVKYRSGSVERFNMIGVTNDTSLKNVYERKGMIRFK